MKLIEDQVISIEQTKKLKELWFKRESYFCRVEWWKLWHDLRSEIHPVEVIENRIALADSAYSLYNAYTASELMDILPSKIINNDWLFELEVWKLNMWYSIHYTSWPWRYIQITWENITQALWNMLIYLLEKNLFPVVDNQWAAV